MSPACIKEKGEVEWSGNLNGPDRKYMWTVQCPNTLLGLQVKSR